jgi:hypothetical protein
MHTKTESGDVKGRDRLEELSMDGKIIQLLERILNIMPQFMTGFIWHWLTVLSTVMNIQVALKAVSHLNHRAALTAEWSKAEPY